MKLAGPLLAVLFISTSCGAPRPLTRPASPDALEVIPSGWLDLPDAPFVAKMLGGKAVLVNRTRRTFDAVSTGCVSQQGRSAQVVGGLFDQRVFDSSWGPGDSVEGLLRMINNIDYYVGDLAKMTGRADALKRCPDGSRIAVIAAAEGNQYRWTAEGTAWTR